MRGHRAAALFQTHNNGLVIGRVAVWTLRLMPADVGFVRFDMPLEPAGAAYVPLAVPDFHDVGEAGVLIREAGEKLTDGQPAEIVQLGLRLGFAAFSYSVHRVISYGLNAISTSYVCQGDNPGKL